MPGGRRRAGPSARGRRWRDLAIAAVIAVALIAAGLDNRDAARTEGTATTAEAVLGTLEARLAVSHTVVEEYVVGDPNVDVNADIRARQAEALRRCGVLRDGGTAAEEAIARLDDAEANARAAALCRSIANFQALTAMRIADPEGQQPGSPAEQRYDVAFESVLARAEGLRDRLKEVGSEQQVRLQFTQWAVVVTLLLLLAAAGLLIRRRERELSTLASEREAVLESAGEGILAVDRDGVVAFANAAAAGILGFDREDLAGRSLRSLLPPAGLPPDGSLPAWLKVDATSHGDDHELRALDGADVPIAYSLSPARARDGSLVITFQDISSRRRREALREVELAELRTIKQALVPPAVHEPVGLEIATRHLAAIDGVAGDFHLVADGPRGTTVIMVGDVAGKGLDAARRGAYLRTALSTFAPYEDEPSRLLQLGNRSLLDATGTSDMFVTVICVVVDAAAGTVAWATAGHPAPIHLFSGATLSGRPGRPLGITSELELDRHVTRLEHGSGLLLYTDGLTEARTGNSESPSLLGREPVSRIIRAHAREGAAEVADALCAVAEEHSEGKLADDLCLVAIRLIDGAAATS